MEIDPPSTPSTGKKNTVPSFSPAAENEQRKRATASEQYDERVQRARNVQDVLSRNFQLQLGPVIESITVVADQIRVNTTDGSVSTIVDQKYVENMPLNGRSFQDLVLLTPGSVTQSPQNTNAQLGETGEFSVNGQRPESNYYTVDGVSANVGTAPGASCLNGAAPAARYLQPLPWELPKGSFQSTISKSFAYRVRPIRRNTVAIRAANFPSTQNRAPINGTAPHMTTCGTVSLTPTIGLTTTLT